MKLPHADSAVVSEAKLVDYLLNPAHPDNGGKVAFFLNLGFSLKNWPALAFALRQLAMETDAAEIFESPHGTKYIIDGWLAGEENRRAIVRSIWIIDQDAEIPRLVTAYPGK